MANEGTVKERSKGRRDRNEIRRLIETQKKEMTNEGVLQEKGRQEGGRYYKVAVKVQSKAMTTGGW